MNFEELPSEIATNKSQFPEHKQRLLEFVIERSGLFGVVVAAKGAGLFQKIFCKKIKNSNPLLLLFLHRY